MMVRISGPGTADVLRRVCGTALKGRGAFRVRVRIGAFDMPGLVATYLGPGSYTGEDAAELLMAGNPHLAERVLGAVLETPGVRLAGPGEFTARAYLNDKLSLEEAEGVAALIAARTEGERAAAEGLMSGRAGEAYRAWAEELTTLLALVEAGIDFTDQEDVVPIAPERLLERVEGLVAAIRERLGAAGGEERADALPGVVLVGAPNAGKSTLFNALLGRARAVVSDEAGTTRDVLAEALDLSGDLPGAGRVVLMDAAGLDGAAAGVDAAAQARAREAALAADVLVHCDPTGRFGAVVGVDGAGRRVIRVRTKADLPAGSGAGGDVAVCALDGWNVGVLRRAIADAAAGSGARGAAAAALLPRHRRALAAAEAGLRSAAEAVRAGGAEAEAEIVAGALREALDALGELTGKVAPDDVIGRIFATFCVGK